MIDGCPRLAEGGPPSILIIFIRECRAGVQYINDKLGVAGIYDLGSTPSLATGRPLVKMAARFISSRSAREYRARVFTTPALISYFPPWNGSRVDSARLICCCGGHRGRGRGGGCWLDMPGVICGEVLLLIPASAEDT